MYQVEFTKETDAILVGLSHQERANHLVDGLSRQLTGTKMRWESGTDVLDGFDHPVRVLTCDLKTKQAHKNQMAWQLKGNPGEYLCLTYFTLPTVGIGYVVALDTYENLSERAKNGWLLCSKKGRASKWLKLNHLDPIPAEPW